MNIRMKTALAAVCLCIVMTGCSNSDQSSKNDASSADSQVTTTTAAAESEVSEKETDTSVEDPQNTEPDKKPVDDSEIAKLAEEIEKKYGVDIVYGNDIRTDYSTDDDSEVLKARAYTDAAGIKNALEQVNEGLRVFPSGLLEKLTSEDGSPMKIYLTGPVGMNGSAPQDGAIPAFTDDHDKETYLVIDISLNGDINIPTVCHEITHIIDFTLQRMGKFDDKKWDSLNPAGFAYTEDYDNYGNSAAAQKHSYTSEHYSPRVPAEGQTDDDLYFYYYYSTVNAYEDRATLLENLIIYLLWDYEVAPGLYSYPHIYEKAKYFLDCISSAFELDDDGFRKWQDTLDKLAVTSKKPE